MQFPIEMHGDVEFRLDNLTGDRARINPARARRPKQAESASDTNALMDMVDKSKVNCVFCPERILDKVPRFPEAIKTNSDGRITRGESIIFPNLSPIGDNHAVGVSTKQHFLHIDEHSPQIIADNMLAMHDFVVATFAAHPTAVWPSFFWNYMPPSAGSVIHPHSQLLVETSPLAEVRRAIAAAEAYAAKHKSNYYADLVAAEKAAGARYVGSVGGVSVVTVFAPRAFSEVLFVLPSISHTLQMTPELAQNFADAVHRVLRGYKALGVGSFNMACFSGPIDKPHADFALHFKLFSRPFPRGIYTNDTGPMERVCGEFVIDTLPEEVAKTLREAWEPKSAEAAAPAPAAAQ